MRMSNITVRFCLFSSVISILCGCMYLYAGNNVQQKFYRQSVSQRKETFRQHSLEEQLDLYFFGNQIRHPPAMYLAECFALNGKEGVDILRQKLHANIIDDLTVRDILMLFTEIDRRNQYDVRADQYLMSELKSKVSKMKDTNWQDLAEDMMMRLENEPRMPLTYVSECK